MNKYLLKIAESMKLSEGTKAKKGPTPVDKSKDAEDSVTLPYNESKRLPNSAGDPP